MRLGIIGAGRVGASFVLAFPSDVEGILCSTEESTLQKARRLHVTAYTDGAELARHCDVLLLTVRDDVLASVSQQLAASLKEDGRLSHRCVFHCSGAMDRLKGIYMADDGDEQARGVAERIVRTLGSTPFFVPSEERMLYHAAACFCSNYVVTALALAQQLMRRWTASDDDAAKALMPLVDGTLQNVRERNVWQTALTGPVSRGDVGTIVKHLAVMPGELIHPYCAFGRAAADLALKNETITAQQHDELTRILAMAEGVYYEQKSNQSDH